MAKLWDELKLDLNFIKSHNLQPRWYKVLKVFILLGVLAGYAYFFGMIKTMVFLGVFLLLSACVHLIYRWKTQRWTQSWLDFTVIEKNGKITPNRIGIFYYAAIVINVLLSVLISQSIF
jgi:uncharacterized membrane protein HdeD (DUF308 family)